MKIKDKFVLYRKTNITMKTSTTNLCIGILSASLCFFSCGGGSQDKQAQDNKTASPAVEATATETASTTLVVEGDDLMKFNTSELKVKVGEPISLTLRHTGKMAKEVMGHNLVLLKKGTDVSAFAQAAMAAKDTEYIPSSLADAVISHTELIGGGEESTITFTLTEAGNYEFICSFPGHAALMKGVVIAE